MNQILVRIAAFAAIALTLGSCSAAPPMNPVLDTLRAGDAGLAAGNYNGAIIAYKKALLTRRSPVRPTDLNHLATAFSGSKVQPNPDLIKILIVEKNPLYPTILHHLAMALNASGHQIDARLILEKLVSDYPSSPEAGLAREALRGRDNVLAAVRTRQTASIFEAAAQSPRVGVALDPGIPAPRREPSSAAQVPTVWSPGERRTPWILLVGVSKYKSPHVPTLPFATRDAERMRDWFLSLSAQEVPRGNVHVLFDEQATRKNLLTEIDWLRRHALPEDAVFVYFAGHGAPELAPDGASVDAKYLLLHDTDPKQLYATGFTFDELTRRLDDVKANVQVVILEACYSGPIGQEILKKTPTADLDIRPRSIRQLGERRGRVILSASSGRQIAIGSEEIAGGLFTHYLLQAWEAEDTGLLTGGFDNAKYEVRRASNQLGSYQEPVKFGDRNLDISF